MLQGLLLFFFNKANIYAYLYSLLEVKFSDFVHKCDFIIDALDNGWILIRIQNKYQNKFIWK